MLIPIRYDILLTVILTFSGLASLGVRTLAGRRRLPYPPGPRRLPIVGNLFSMPSREEWVTYMNWSKDFGTERPVHARCIRRQPFNTDPRSGSEVVHVDILGSHIVILNSMKSANELLEKKSSIYSDRYGCEWSAVYYS
jgi:hypothetical protein